MVNKFSKILQWYIHQIIIQLSIIVFFFCCRMGYEGLWKKRTNELYDEGEATFYKTSRFTVVESNTYSLADLANKVKSCILLYLK